MSKDQINQFDSTASNNTDIEGINTSETMVPSAVNNSIRSLMSLLKKQDVGTHAMTSPNIDGGTVDGANITVGSGKTLDVSAGTLTLANDQISGDKINGGSISSTFVGNLTGDVTGNASGSAATVTGAAQSAITSVGTLTSLTSGEHIPSGDNNTALGSDAARWGSVTCGGRVTFGWGSAGAPGLAISAMTTTGLFRAAADTIGFSTGGAERMRLNSTGEFSVNTTSATGMINVTASSWSKNCLYLNSSTSGDADFCGIGMTTAGTESANIYTDESHNFSVTKTGAFNIKSGSSGISGGVTDLQVDANGNVAMAVHNATLATFAADKSNGSGFSMVSPDGDALQIYQLKTSDVESHIGFKSGTDTNWYLGTASGLGGIGSAGVYQTNTGAGWTNVSDERYKKSLQPITNALDKIKDCRGMTGLYKTDPDDRDRRSFLIAQDWIENDLGPVLPEAVDQNTTDDDDVTEKFGLQYDATIPLLVEAIKELRTQNIALTERISTLEGN